MPMPRRLFDIFHYLDMQVGETEVGEQITERLKPIIFLQTRRIERPVVVSPSP